MAKRKLTTAQRKAKKRAAYIRSEYMKNYRALEYLKQLNVVDIKYKTPKNITKSTLATIRKVYKKARKEAEKTGAYLPTKAEMSKEIRYNTWSEYNKYEQYKSTQEPEPPTFEDINQQYIDEVKQRLETIRESHDTVYATRGDIATKKPKEERGKDLANFNKNVVPKFEQAINRILGAIDQAVASVGVIAAAEILASDPFMQRVANLDEKYTYQIMESQANEDDDDIVSFIEASVDEALKNT